MPENTQVVGEVEIAVKANLDQLRAITPQVEAEAKRLYAAASSAFDSRTLAAYEANMQKLADTVNQVNRNLNVKDNFDTAGRAKDIEAYGAQLDKVREQFNPLFAAQQRFNTTMMDAQRALATGAISQEEYGMAAMRAQAALNTQTDAIQRSNQALLANQGVAKLNALQFQNMQYQVNDLAMGLMTGANPFTLITQQGLQIAQIFKPGSSLMSAMEQFGTGIVAFVTNPINVAIIGIAAAAGGAVLLWNAINNGGRSSAEVLKDHDKFINDIVAGWKDAKTAYDDYLKEHEKLPAESVITRSVTSQSQLGAQLDQQMAQIGQAQQALNQFYNTPRTAKAINPEALAEVNTLINKLKVDGPAGVVAFQDGLSRLKLRDDLGASLQAFIDGLDKSAQYVGDLNAKLGATADMISKLSGATIIGDTFGSLGGTSDALKRIQALTPDLRTAKQQVQDILKQNNASGTSLQQNKDLAAAADYAIKQIDAQTAAQKALTDARKADAEAQRRAKEMIKNDQMIKDLQAQINLLQSSHEGPKQTLALLKQQEDVQNAIKSLGDSATAAQIAAVEKLIPLKADLIKANEDQEASIQRQNTLYQQLGSTMGDVFKQWQSGAITAKQAMLELAKAAALAAIKSMFMGQSNNSMLGDNTFLGGFLGSLFGGGRASGGDVEAGKVYRVNENTGNSELFVPKVNGVIVPHSNYKTPSNDNKRGGDTYVVIPLAGAVGEQAIKDHVIAGLTEYDASLPGKVRDINIKSRNMNKVGAR